MKFTLNLTTLLATSILTATPLAAQETITYQYDALGRLVEVSTDGGPADNVNSDYTYDKAGNRTLVAVSGAAGGAPAPDPAPNPTPDPDPEPTPDPTPPPPPPPAINCSIAILDSFVDGVAAGDIVSHTAYVISATGTCNGAVITYATQNGTGSSPTNYTATSGTLTLGSNPGLQGVTINGIRLTTTVARTFRLNFASTTPGVTFTDAQALITIESGSGN